MMGGGVCGTFAQNTWFVAEGKKESSEVRDGSFARGEFFNI